MRILHLDAGREMRGGQWQVLRLLEGLASAGVESTLLAWRGGPLFDAARKREWRVEPFNLMEVVGMAGRHDLMHAHDARSHSLGAFLRGRRGCEYAKRRNADRKPELHDFSSRYPCRNDSIEI